MHTSLKQRILSGILAVLLLVSNVNLPVNAAETAGTWQQEESMAVETQEADDASGSETVQTETESPKEEPVEKEAESSVTETTKSSVASETEEQPEDDTVDSVLPESTEKAENQEDTKASEFLKNEEVSDDTAVSVQAEENGGDDQAQPDAAGTIKLTGAIDYDDTVEGTDWSKLVRPLKFNQKIKVIQRYQKADGTTVEQTYYAQDDLSNQLFYLKFTHDGNGDGTFVIENVPKAVTDGETSCSVTKYTLSVESTLPYYTSDEMTVSMQAATGATAAAGTLLLRLQTENMTLRPEIVPEGSQNDSFKMKAVFTNDELKMIGESSRSQEYIYTASTAADKLCKIKVPVGLNYEITQTEKDGYRLSDTYVVTTTSKDSEPPVSNKDEQSRKATGVIEKEKTTEITTVNYAQNASLPFNVRWIDNNNPDRPEISADYFVLQYKVGEDDWAELTTEASALLGMKNLPQLDTSKALQGEYAYRGLAVVTADGKEVSYRVILNENKLPEPYVCTVNDDAGSRRTFTFAEQTVFHAKIVWNDTSDQTKRPTAENMPLKLYRRAGNGNFAALDSSVLQKALKQTSTTGNTWDISVTDIPRYDANNQEYEYVLVQGTIDGQNTVSQMPVSGYKTYYSNGSGNFGNNISLCYDNGTVTEVLHDTVTITVKKEWKDPEGSAENRPEATFTLWRYIKKDGITGIDDAYARGVAAQVVYQTRTAEGEEKDHIVSCKVSNDKDSSVTFDETMTGGVSLPKYDAYGQEYVYFVRETLSGTGEDDFTACYTGADETEYTSGVPDGGTVQNIRRKKEAVTITKVWKNRAGLGDVQKASVYVQIQAHTADSETYEDLTVYENKTDSFKPLTGDALSQAQQITGFTDELPRGETTYYVNTRDANGVPYDMSTARLIETVKIGDQEYRVTTDADGNSRMTIENDTYTVKSAYVGQSTLSGGMTQYRYTQTNTIEAYRQYRLTKVWDESISEEQYQDIKEVKFYLERRTTNPHATGADAEYKPVGTTGYWTIQPQEGNTWTAVVKDLPQYDEEGYAYYYRATESSFVYTNRTEITGEAARKDPDKQWIAEYYRTSEETKVINRRYQENAGSFTVSKIWQDNADTANRKDVHVRIYRRSALLAELQGSAAADDVGLSELQTRYRELTLSQGNQYTAQVVYSTLEEALGKPETGTSTDWRAYIVLEYCVGDPTDAKTIPARYDRTQLLTALAGADTYSISGTVENADRQYTVQVSLNDRDSGTVLLTNTRTGTSAIEVVKNWQDDRNIKNTRPTSVRFQLYQDGELYRNIPEKVQVKVTSEDTDAQANCTVAIDRTAGILTVTRPKTDTSSKWCFTIEGLDRFSDAGDALSYDLDEIQTSEKTANDTTYYYTQNKEKATVCENGKVQTYTFHFTNTVTGTVEHVAYKYWKDAGIAAENRPDLYMNLYQYLEDEYNEKSDTPVSELTSYKAYKDYKELIWQTESDVGDPNDSCHGYDWKIIVKNLPQFDASGHEYGYVFTEAMSNDGNTVFGTYRAETAKISLKNAMTDTQAGTSYEIFTNTISDYMTIQGKKIWTGLSGYSIAEKDLPDPEIELYRTTDKTITDLNGKNDTEIVELVKNKTITLVDTTHLTGSKAGGNDKTRYSFPGTNVTEDQLQQGLICVNNGSYVLPKYDENGNRYTYLIREKFGDSSIAGQLYTQLYSSGTLSNTFRNDVNRRKIVVNKVWEGRDGLPEGENKYPSLTFKLYRYEKEKEEDTTTLLKTSTVQPADGNVSVTFDDLLVYSPSGVQYCYYVTEDTVSGYSVAYYDEDEKTSTDNSRSNITSLPSGWNTAQSASETTVTIRNSYDQKGKLTISGEKIWDDYNNEESLRPEDITIVLERYTDSENGWNNAVNKTKVSLDIKTAMDPDAPEPYIVWQKGTGDTAGIWTYTIYNLERYAPNGRLYTYTVTENPVDKYQQAATVTGKASAADTIKMSQMTNRFPGSYYVRKNWMDGGDKYNLRPTEITVQLQRRKAVDADTAWQNYHESVTLSSKNAIPNTNSWQYTFENLPLQDVNGNTYEYRCIETEIGGIPLKPDNTAGSYTCAYETKTRADGSTYTVIENTLDSTSLVVTKKWVNDQDNAYHTRPDHLEFVLQKRGKDNNDTLESWETVKKADGSPYTFTITPDASGNWTKTLTDLPVAEVIKNADGNTQTVYSLYFRAVELHTDDTVAADGQKQYGTGTSVNGAKNYKDITGYAPDSSAHVYNDEAKCNESTITNELILRDPSTITVSKVWRKTDAEEQTAAFELLYRVAGETDWHCYGDQPLEKASGTDQELMTGNDWTKHQTEKNCKILTLSSTQDTTVQWEQLPKYNREGTAYEYKVIEHPVTGYKTDIVEKTTSGDGTDADAVTGSSAAADVYTFTNIELQEYTVEKIWQNTAYAEKLADGFTAKFQLQQKVEGATEWSMAAGQNDITLVSAKANAAQQASWQNLPKYTVDGNRITYRAVETMINGKAVSVNTNGAYMVSYQYETAADKTQGGQTQTTSAEPSFGNIKTVVTNRMIYGFVNLSKQAAYLAAEGIRQGTPTDKLGGITFDIYKAGTLAGKEDRYVSGIQTDENGNLICNADGTYGSGNASRYLVAGDYILKETSAGASYSIWKNGIRFSVGSGNGSLPGDGAAAALTNTGEHGTAWISTDNGINPFTLNLQVSYIAADATSHTIGDGCTAKTAESTALDLESRGIITFIKTGPKKNSTTIPLDTHSGATGEDYAYFGVYLDSSCTNQVAGLVPEAIADTGSSDKTKMVLTDKDIQEKALPEHKNSDGLSYLRGYTENNGNTDNADNTGTNAGSTYPFTLLAGDYYIKELRAPAGYRQDTTVRKATVKNVPTDTGTDITNFYLGNVAEIAMPGETATGSYEWSNEPTKVKLYKLDQFGRKVTLKENGYLELEIKDAESTFPSGETKIRLYQNSSLPALKANGTALGGNYVTYDATENAWTINGLLVCGKTYTLSEPQGSVPDNNIVAHLVTFTINADGKMVLAGENQDYTEKNDTPLQKTGTSYKNMYKPDAAENILVLRDVARYLKDVAIRKLDADTNTPIANISFRLYKYESEKADGTPQNPVSVLAEGVYLTTGTDGKIDLQNLDPAVINQITGCQLSHGLDVGKYYFSEVERGASDQYRLAEDIFFTIEPKEGTDGTAYADYAKVTYVTDGRLDVTTETDGKTVRITNTPVTTVAKTLELTKVDSDDADTRIAWARFILQYTSVNAGHDGAAEQTSWKCMTAADGQLYLTDDNWNFISEGENRKKPDISGKGEYTLTEVQAPDGYMTRTAAGTDTPVTLATFQVDSDNHITGMNYYTGTGNLISGEVTTETEGSDEHLALRLTVRNEKTRVAVAKRNDIESGTKATATKTCDQTSLQGELLSGATLEIYEGTDPTDNGKKRVTLGRENGEDLSSFTWNCPDGTASGTGADIPAGALKENTVYTLHESEPPVGYLAAKDIYFKLSATTEKGGTVISRLYVWTGTDKPQSVDQGEWSETKNLNDHVLTMVDEAIIAPVDMQKVYGKDGKYEILAGAEFCVRAGNTVLGTAESDAGGYLVWKEITEAGYAAKAIFNADGKRVSQADASTVLGHTLILQQNADGYTFTENYAPAQAYNEGKSLTVRITADNYREYRRQMNDGPTYDTTAYIDIKAAAEAADGSHTVGTLSHKNETASLPTEEDFVNPAFETTFEIRKFDATDRTEDAATAGLKGVVFTLSEKTGVDGAGAAQYRKLGDYTTGEQGILSVPLSETGEYRLQEIQALDGYQLNGKILDFTVTKEDFRKTLTYDETQAGHTKVIKEADSTGVDTATPYAFANYKVYLEKTGEDGTTALQGTEFILQDACANVGDDPGVHKLADGSAEKQIVTAADGKVEIPTMTLTGGHTYSLTETKAPEGYTATAKATFKLNPDGSVDPDSLTSTGGYAEENEKCVSLDGRTNTIRIRDERIPVILTKVDADDTGRKLAGAVFAITPYGTVSDGADQGKPSAFRTDFDMSGYTYDTATRTMAFTTDTDGRIVIPNGLLKHFHSYLLRETASKDGYYLSRETSDGVILHVGGNGDISIQRQVDYSGKTLTEGDTEKSSCPVQAENAADGRRLTVTNRQSTAFTLTKQVTGNMGDLNGTFTIRLKVSEPDGTSVGEKQITLKNGEIYDSETGRTDLISGDTQAFGKNAIPVQAVLEIAEPDDRLYAAEIVVTSSDGHEILRQTLDDGKVSLTLNSTQKVSIVLTNSKDAILDVGVSTENKAPWAAVALILPVVWIAYRKRKKEREKETM